jgi:4-amino-4-deoxy-L-arabinose transferase-like glycosyltransferase
MEQPGRANRDWALVGLITGAGLLLRLVYVLRVPPFLDEYSSMLTGMSILHTGGVPQLPSGVLYPSGLLFSYLEAAFIGLFGFSDFVARLPSLLVSGLTLPILYTVARKLFGQRTALLSVALLALTPEAVVWGGRARMYALLQLLVLLAIFFFYRCVLEARPDGGSRSGRVWPWIPFFLAAIFAQDEAILLLPAFWLAAWIARGFRWFLKPAVLLGQVLVPLAGVGARYWLNEIRVPGEVHVGIHHSFFRFPPAIVHGLKGIAPFFIAPWVWPVTILFCVALGLVAWRRITSSERRVLHWTPQGFLAYAFLVIAAAMVLVVNTPWQDDRYLVMVLPAFLMVASWGLDWMFGLLVRRWPVLRSEWVTRALVALVALAALPGGVTALHRTEPDYSAAYRWVAAQLADGDLVTTKRPAPAAVYLGDCDFLVAEDRYQEFVMRLDGVWVDRWAGAKVIASPESFREEVLRTGQRVWFVIDEDRFESVAYSPEFVALILQQMELVWHEGDVLVFRGQGFEPPPDMAVTKVLDANFADQLRLTGYALSTDHPDPGQEVVVQLLWQALQPERNYTVFLHLTGADGQRLAQLDGEPFKGLYGMSTHWPRDRSVVDERRLILPQETPPGRYRLEVGLYDAGEAATEPLSIQGTGQRSLTLDFLHVDIPQPPAPSQMVGVGNLGGLVRLVGHDLALPARVTAGTGLPLVLIWECLGSFTADYTVYIHLAGSDGRPVGQVDSQPLGGSYPTRFWDVGALLSDPYVLEIPAGVSPGEYELRVGMYLATTGDRLSLLGSDGRVLGDGISLGRVEVGSP